MAGTKRRKWTSGSAQARRLEAGDNQMITDNPRSAVDEFKQAVNMSPKALARWLTTAESKAVGFKTAESSESVGHQSGKKIVALLGKCKAEFTSGDIAHARKVVGYIHRHLAQRPAGDIGDTPWRYSLMNWGHDPQEGKS